jgi:hypothetical protein
MATLGEIREALRVRVATIDGLHTYRIMSLKPEPPACCVIPRSAQFSQTFDGDVLYTFDVWVYVSPTDLERAQAAIDEYMAPTGAKSIAAAIHADQSLGGVVDYARVIGWVDYGRMLDVAGGQLLSAPLQVEVRAR